MKRPAFTLLELLVSSALFAVIVVLIVGVLATTTITQNAGLQSQVVSSQLQRAMSTLETSLSRATIGGLKNYQGGDGVQASADSFLIFQTNSVLPDGTGAGTAGSGHYEVWCINPSPINGWSDTLLQITMPVGATLARPPAVSNNNIGDLCYTSTVAGWFSDAGGNPLNAAQVGTNEIADSSVKMGSFFVQTVQADGATTDTIQAFSIELSGTYVVNGYEQRTDTQLSRPIVLRGTALVGSNPPVSNLSQ